MNLIKSNFSGIDASNEISLLEYGLLVYNDKHEDGSGTRFCVYKITEDSFGTGHIAESEINDLVTGKSWMDENDVNEFHEFVGIGKDEYLQTSFVNKLSDLIGYYGVENIFGTDYSPITESEAREFYL